MHHLIRGTVLSMLLMLSVPAFADPVHDLVLAAQIDNPVAVKKLLASGLSPNTLAPVTGEPLLIVAIREGSKGVSELLLAEKGLDIELSAPNGNTALMMAAFKHNQAVLEKLLARGAVVNRQGWTALHYAAAGGDAAIVALLAGKGAVLDAVAPNGLTPLMLASSEGHPEAVGVLLERGANAAFVNQHGQSAREAALYRDRPDIVKLLDAHLAGAARQK